MDEIPAGVIDRPQGERPLLDDLSLRELRVANAKLRGDVCAAITERNADRWDALALVGWLWHKRQDPTAKLDGWTNLTAGQLYELLHLNGDQVDVEDDGSPHTADPTVDQGDDPDDGEPAADWTADPAAELAADPTVPAPAP